MPTLDDAPEPKGLPEITANWRGRELIDADGDRWVEVTPNQWDTEPVDYDEPEYFRTLEQIKATWSPVVFITDAPPDHEPEEETPNADLLEDLEALIDELQLLRAHADVLAQVTGRQSVHYHTSLAYGVALAKLEAVVRGDKL